MAIALGATAQHQWRVVDINSGFSKCPRVACLKKNVSLHYTTFVLWL